MAFTTFLRTLLKVVPWMSLGDSQLSLSLSPNFFLGIKHAQVQCALFTACLSNGCSVQKYACTLCYKTVHNGTYLSKGIYTLDLSEDSLWDNLR